MTDTAQLARTPLYDWHADHQGRLVDFAGWAMPVQYGSIVEEHVATRTGVGLFDVSHMGRLSITGLDATSFLNHVLTRRVTDLRTDRIRYALVCNEAGGVLDDILAGRLAEDRFALVVNASNRGKILDWFEQHREGFEILIEDPTEATAMIAVQGPQSIELLSKFTDTDFDSLKYYASARGDVAGVSCAISRTGYTGEDGCELVCSAGDAVKLWTALYEAGGKPCGLASRDTLRLEAGMPLYGHELSEILNPLHAGLGFAVDFQQVDKSKRDFIGSEALIKAREDGALAQRIGLKVEGKRPPREDYRVMVDGRPCGVVTSGTHSPTLGQPIAMAYVEPQLATIGTRLAIDVRGTETPASVTALPFYRRTK